MESQLWIESVGGIIIARVRGTPTEALLEEAQEKVLFLVRETGQARILYDALELEVPRVEVPMSQWILDEEIKPLNLKRAIVVPNTKIAYLARLAFGEDSDRVFYNDLAAATSWLTS